MPKYNGKKVMSVPFRRLKKGNTNGSTLYRRHVPKRLGLEYGISYIIESVKGISNNLEEMNLTIEGNCLHILPAKSIIQGWTLERLNSIKFVVRVFLHKIPYLTYGIFLCIMEKSLWFQIYQGRATSGILTTIPTNHRGGKVLKKLPHPAIFPCYFNYRLIVTL